MDWSLYARKGNVLPAKPPRARQHPAPTRRSTFGIDPLEERLAPAVLELLPNIPWNKGDAVRWICERVRRQGAVYPVYLGDDVTDQDAFRELQGQGYCVAASDRVTGGDAQVDGPAQIAVLLAALADGL